MASIIFRRALSASSRATVVCSTSLKTAEKRRTLFNRSNFARLGNTWSESLFLERKKANSKGGRDNEDDSSQKKGAAGKKGEKAQKILSADDWEKGPTEENMKQIVENLKTELGSVRIGRAEPSFLANVIIDGKPISKWGQIQVKDASTLSVTLFDPTNIPKLTKGLEESELKLNASSDGRVVLVPIPRATKELKMQKIKQATVMAENSRNEIRKARKKSMDELKANKVPEDDQKVIEKQIQKLHDDYIKQIDQLAKKKEEELNK